MQTKRFVLSITTTCATNFLWYFAINVQYPSFLTLDSIKKSLVYILAC